MSGEDGRLAWRCRRGMKELDLVLTRFLRERWPDATIAERVSFERVLDLPDPLLVAYLTGRERSPDSEVQGLLDQMRQRGFLKARMVVMGGKVVVEARNQKMPDVHTFTGLPVA